MRKSAALIITILVLALLFFWVYLPVLTKYRNLKEQELAIDAELERLNREIRNLSEEKNRLQNDVYYLEKVIREELGLVKPGEIVYKFVEEPAARPAEQIPADQPAA